MKSIFSDLEFQSEYFFYCGKSLSLILRSSECLLHMTGPKIMHGLSVMLHVLVTWRVEKKFARERNMRWKQIRVKLPL